MKEMFRKLPQVSEVIESDKIKKLIEEHPDSLVKDSVRNSIEFFRKKILAGEVFDLTIDDVIDKSIEFLEKSEAFSLAPVINATGVILHTNLGRALINKDVVKNLVTIASSYSNLEYDLDKGKRGSRYVHAVELLKKITGAEDALVVNNNAAAVFLILNTLSDKKDVIVSRGELVEVGGSFRISSIMEKSGANLIEVGATNKTHLYDYEDNITENTNAVMKVHASNYAVVGFTDQVGADELRDFCSENNLYLIEDLGSGSLIDLRRFGLSYERTVLDCIEDGIDLVSFSGDKILGGPQAGIIVGKKKLIDKIKKNQLLRAFRVDKFTLAGLEASLKFYLDEDAAIENIPSLKMISESSKELTRKATKLKEKIDSLVDIDNEIVDCQSGIGGGAYPLDRLDSKAISINPPMSVALFEEKMRLSESHIIGIVHDDRYFMDLRTIQESELDRIARTIKEIIKNK